MQGKLMITCKPLQQKDFPLLAHWFKQPHVAQWWSAESIMSCEQINEKYLAKIRSPDQAAFIVYLNDTPIGYIQYYDASKYSQPIALVRTASINLLENLITSARVMESR